ncbi:hypothetical protein AT05_10585 [Schleiferia thermophila str. Yellowstone]|nr:hypothetical protein AT05_10585 [Schleiferia thermophila str. Yellowstone]
MIVNSTQLKDIENKIKVIRSDHNLTNLNSEIKWQDLWQLRNYFKQNKKPKDKRLLKIYNYLLSIKSDYHRLIDYCENVISIITEYDLKIILSFTVMNKYTNYKPESIIKFHIQDHLQRIQMQYPNSSIIIVYDSLNEPLKRTFKQIHKKIVTSGDFVKYNSIFGSLLFDDSFDNGLMQIADYVAGAFANVLKAVNSNTINNYQKAIDFFYKYIFPNLAKKDRGDIWGIGIKETPKDDDIRKGYSQKIDDLISKLVNSTN